MDAPFPRDPDKRRVFVVDDHPIVRHGLAALLTDQSDLTLCGESAAAPDVLKVATAGEVELVILELALRAGDGLELCRQLHDHAPDVRLLVLSALDEQLYAERCLRAGAGGYVMKHESLDHLLAAVRRVLGGQVHLSPPMTDKLLRSFSTNHAAAETASPLHRLTDREMEIFRLVGHGETVGTIAARLFLSPKTVEAHKEHMKRKLNLGSNRELLQYAIGARDGRA